MGNPTFHGIATRSTCGAERDNLGDWVGSITIDGDEYEVRPNGRDGALLTASGLLQLDQYDDGTRQIEADADGIVYGVAGRIGQIVAGVYVAREDWTREDLGMAVRS
jgi:lipopolysaccharide export system protein LptA